MESVFIGQSAACAFPLVLPTRLGWMSFWIKSKKQYTFSISENSSNALWEFREVGGLLGKSGNYRQAVDMNPGNAKSILPPRPRSLRSGTSTSMPAHILPGPCMSISILSPPFNARIDCHIPKCGTGCQVLKEKRHQTRAHFPPEGPLLRRISRMGVFLKSRNCRIRLTKYL